MKKTNLLLVAFLILGVALLISCKKETKIEKNLWKNGGEWNIESMIATQISTNSADNFNETIYNYGTFTFKKDPFTIKGAFLLCVTSKKASPCNSTFLSFPENSDG